MWKRAIESEGKEELIKEREERFMQCYTHVRQGLIIKFNTATKVRKQGTLKILTF